MAAPFFLLALALSIQAAESPSRADACALPASLRDALQQRFKSSRVLKAADLYEDERGMFRAEHPGACPGVTHGRFFGSKERPAVAIVLLDLEPKKNVRLVVARPAMSAWTFLELDEMDQGSTAVVGKKAPGTYTGLREATTRRSANEVVVLTAYETWQRVYVWNGRTFEKVELSY